MEAITSCATPPPCGSSVRGRGISSDIIRQEVYMLKKVKPTVDEYQAYLVVGVFVMLVTAALVMIWLLD